MSDFYSRQKSDRGPAELGDLTLIVRPPGQPASFRTFTDAECAEAELFANEARAAVETLRSIAP